MLMKVAKLQWGTSFSKVRKSGAKTACLNVLATNLLQNGLQWCAAIANGGYEIVTISEKLCEECFCRQEQEVHLLKPPVGRRTQSHTKQFLLIRYRSYKNTTHHTLSLARHKAIRTSICLFKQCVQFPSWTMKMNSFSMGLICFHVWLYRNGRKSIH